MAKGPASRPRRRPWRDPAIRITRLDRSAWRVVSDYMGVVDGRFEPIAGIVRESLTRHLPGLEELLRQCTVFFGVVDEKAETVKIAGSGVLADLQGTKVVLAAGHVLRDFRNQFNDELVWLSINASHGHLVIRRDATRLYSPDGDAGADAGVLMLPPDQVETYFQYGNFNPVGRTTLHPTLPPLGMDCLIAGYPAAHAGVPQTHIRSHGKHIVLQPKLVMFGAHLNPSDSTHHWLHAGGAAQNCETGEWTEMRGGDLGGMSGGGFWSMTSRRNPATDLVVESLLRLHGVHTGSDGHQIDRLRQTPIEHHLRLLAGHSDVLREKVRLLWPTVELD